MTAFKKILIASSLLAGVGFAYLYRQYKLLYNSVYKLIGVTVYEMTARRIKFKLVWRIENTGDLSARIVNQSYRIYINGSFVSSIESKDEILIASNGISFLPLTIQINPSQLIGIGIKNIGTILFNKSGINFGIQGKLDIRAGVVNLKDYTINETISLQEIIDMAKTPTEE